MRIATTLAIAVLIGLGTVSDTGLAGKRPPDPWSQLMLEYPELVDYVPFEDAVRRSKETDRPVLMVFTNPKCGPCCNLHVGILSDPVEAAFINAHYVPVKVLFKLSERDGLTITSEDTALKKRFQPRGVPTVIILSPTGRELTRFAWAGREKTSQLLKRVARENSKGKLTPSAP